jgi:hypothetical protein
MFESCLLNKLFFVHLSVKVPEPQTELQDMLSCKQEELELDQSTKSPCQPAKHAC